MVRFRGGRCFWGAALSLTRWTGDRWGLGWGLQVTSSFVKREAQRTRGQHSIRSFSICAPSSHLVPNPWRRVGREWGRLRRDKPTLKRSAAWAGFRKSKVAWRGPGGPVRVGRCSHPWGRGRGDGAMPGAQGGRPYVDCLVGPGPLEKGPSTCATWLGDRQESKGPQVSSGQFHWLNDPEARGRRAC